MPTLDDVGATKTGEFVRPRFGVEIEFTNSEGAYVDETDLAVRLNNVGLRCVREDYNHGVRSHWKLTTDSSVGGDRGQGLELVSPPMRFEDRHSIRLAMQVVKDAGGRITSKCGFHVHHEWPWNLIHGRAGYGSQQAQGRLAQLLWMYDKFLPLVGVLIPRNRLTMDCQYTHSNKRGMFVAQFEGRDRYVAVNFAPLNDGRNTVEFRQHQGTLNGAKALAWVEFTRQMIGAATNEYHERAYSSVMSDGFNTWSALLEPHVQDVLGKLTPGSKKYIEARCIAKGTTLERILELVMAREPDDPLNYGDPALFDKHAAAVAETLGATAFESSDV